jgi:hypothetical protein
VFDSFTYRSYKSQPDDSKISHSTSYSFRSFIPSLFQFFYLSRSIPSLIANSKSLFNHLKLSSSKIPSLAKSKSLPISLFHLFFSLFLLIDIKKRQNKFNSKIPKHIYKYFTPPRRLLLLRRTLSRLGKFEAEQGLSRTGIRLPILPFHPESLPFDLERGLQVFHPDFEEVVFKTIDEAVRRKNREEVRWAR